MHPRLCPCSWNSNDTSTWCLVTIVFSSCFWFIHENFINFSSCAIFNHYVGGLLKMPKEWVKRGWEISTEKYHVFVLYVSAATNEALNLSFCFFSCSFRWTTKLFLPEHVSVSLEGCNLRWIHIWFWGFHKFSTHVRQTNDDVSFRPGIMLSGKDVKPYTFYIERVEKKVSNIQAWQGESSYVSRCRDDFRCIWKLFYILFRLNPNFKKIFSAPIHFSLPSNNSWQTKKNY